MPGVRPHDPGIVRRADQSGAGNRDLLRARFDRDKDGAVMVLIVVFRFQLRADQVHVPCMDLLAVGGLGRQPQALQPVRDRLVEAVMRGVANGQAHQAVNR